MFPIGPGLERRLRGSGSLGSRLRARLLEHHRSGSCQIDQPMLLISQLPRMGGSGLNQRLDHHPAIWSIPAELHIGYPKKWDWPKRQWADLPASRIYDLLAGCGPKQDLTSRDLFFKGSEDRLPMNMLPRVGSSLFRAILAMADPAVSPDGRGAPTPIRRCLNAFFSTYFLTWLDHQNKYTPPGCKRYVAGHAAILAIEPGFLEVFRQDYPDGRIVHLIRDPHSWYNSIKGLGKEGLPQGSYSHYCGLDQAVEAYRLFARMVKQNLAVWPEGILAVRFQDFARRPEAMMRVLAHWLGIEYSPVLLESTFNGMPIRPNTSFPGQRSDLIGEREQERLAPLIPLFEELESLCVPIGEVPEASG